jgi:TPR repeat protein
MLARIAAAWLAAASVFLPVNVTMGDDVGQGIEAFARGDYAAAHASFAVASEDGDPGAAPWLATDYYLGWGVKANEMLAQRWLDAAKNQTTPDDLAQAVLHWRRLADAGDPSGAVALGRAYENGIGVTASPVEAYRLYRIAAERGHARGQYALASMYASGVGVKADSKEAMRLFNLAAAQGDDWSQYQIGGAFVTGTGVRRNFRTAAEWLTRAAQAGNALAMYNLAVMYDQGDGVRQDFAEAFRWYKQAATQGVPNAQNNLAVLHYRGQGVAKDVGAAYEFSTIAHDQESLAGPSDGTFDFAYRTIQAELSEPERRAAVFHLGERCRDGDSLPRDAVQAYRYMTIAINSEPEVALKEQRTKARDAMAATMRGAQVARALSLAESAGPP